VLAGHPFPFVKSLGLIGPATTSASSVVWSVTFSEPVTGADAGEFVLKLAGVHTGLHEREKSGLERG